MRVATRRFQRPTFNPLSTFFKARCFRRLHFTPVRLGAASIARFSAAPYRYKVCFRASCGSFTLSIFIRRFDGALRACIFRFGCVAAGCTFHAAFVAAGCTLLAAFVAAGCTLRLPPSRPAASHRSRNEDRRQDPEGKECRTLKSPGR